MTNMSTRVRLSIVALLLHRLVAAITAHRHRIFACLLLAAAVPAWGQVQCPADNPDTNYNCPVGPPYAMPGWGNVPWSQPKYYQTIRTGDLDGDGRDELIGRDARGVQVWSFNVSLGVWQPWIASDGSGPMILPLSDAASWDLPQYYSTIRLATLVGVPGKKVLVARAGNGLNAWQVNPATSTVSPLPAGTWSQIAFGGAFADSGCFANGRCWSDPRYANTLMFADVDGESGDEAIAWGGDGIAVAKWTSSGWTALAGIPQAGDAASFPAHPSSLRAGNLDGTAGKELLMWTVGTSGGIASYQYTSSASGGAWTALPTVVIDNLECDLDPSCYSTLTAVPFGSGTDAVFIRMSGCSAGGGGMLGVRFNPTTKQWSTLTSGGPLDDCSGFTGVQYYETIRFAQITGNTLPELLARDSGGVIVYQWNGSGWSMVSPTTPGANVPALANGVWDSDPSYYQSFRTATIDGSGRAAFIARGQAGVRTWLWQNGALARPLAFGNFPAFTGNQATAYSALNSLVVGQGTIRDLYANPNVTNTQSSLAQYLSSIVSTGSGCTGKVSDNPPRYTSCPPLPGTQNPEYTQVVNQLIQELWWASFVVGYFDQIGIMQNALFQVEDNVFPDIVSNLQLSVGSGTAGAADYLGLFAGIASLIGDITGQPEIGVAADAIGLFNSALPFFQNPQKTSFQHTYDQMKSQIQSFQQVQQNLPLSQMHNVLSDYATLSTVGALTASQVWTFSPGGYLSYNRQAFTIWVYQAFMPIFWDLYEVTNCREQGPPVKCTAPPNGPYMGSYSPNGVNFTGLLLPGGSCDFTSCTFQTPDPATASFIATPPSAECTFDSLAGTSWVYANTPNAPVSSCSLGAAPAVFGNRDGWNFDVIQINVADAPLAIDQNSHASGIGTSRSRLRLRGVTSLVSDDLDLRTTRLTLRRLLDEPYAGGELVGDSLGNGFVPIALLADRSSARYNATFITPRGYSPRTSVDVRLRSGKKELAFDIDVDDGLIMPPLRCRGTPPTTKLHVTLNIEGGGLLAPLTLSQVADWECTRDRNGKVKALRMFGNPTLVYP